MSDEMRFDAKLSHISAQLGELQKSISTLVYAVNDLADSHAELSKRINAITTPSPNGVH